MKKKWLWILVVCYTLWIFSNSLMNGETSGNTSGSLTRMIYTFVHQILPSVTFDSLHHFIRKAAHFSEYALLGILVYTANRKSPFPKHPKTFLYLYGIIIPAVDETIQLFVPDRCGSIKDVLLDHCGYLTGLLFLFLIYKCFTRTQADS